MIKTIEELKPYIISLPDDVFKMIDKRINEYGAENYLNIQIGHLDCSRVYNSGIRAMQTIGYPYQYEMTSYVMALNKLEKGEIRDKYVKLLIDTHNNNIEFETNNPPVWYEKKSTKKRTSRKTSDKETPTSKEKKPSAKAIKAAQKAMKLNMLTFKLKKV